MHKVYENDDLMMYFKKRFCHYCASAMRRKRTERIVRKGDPDHREYCMIGTHYKPYGDILVVGKEYYCPVCDKSFSCDEQGKIIQAQKYYKRKVVSYEEINAVYSNIMSSAIKKIKRYRWILLLPIVGGLAYMFLLCNGILREKMGEKDGTKLLLSSILIMTGVALVTKFALSIFNNVEGLNAYKNGFILLSMLSFNAPVLWYINQKF